MTPLALLSPRVWLELAVAAAIAGVCWWGYTTIYDRGAASVQTKWDAANAAQQAAIAKQVAEAQAKTKATQDAADAAARKANDDKAVLNRNLAAALDSLRNRPERPASGADAAHAAVACTGQTGASLARGDAEFLVRYSSDAKRLQIALEQCEAAYTAAQQALTVKASN